MLARLFDFQNTGILFAFASDFETLSPRMFDYQWTACPIVYCAGAAKIESNSITINIICYKNSSPD